MALKWCYQHHKNISIFTCCATYGVPQGSILGLLLFNIHLCDLFYFLENLEIPSYADDTTIYTVNETKDSVIGVLETSSSLLFGWLNNNFMKANSDKSELDSVNCSIKITL